MTDSDYYQRKKEFLTSIVATEVLFCPDEVYMSVDGEKERVQPIQSIPAYLYYDFFRKKVSSAKDLEDNEIFLRESIDFGKTYYKENLLKKLKMAWQIFFPNYFWQEMFFAVMFLKYSLDDQEEFDGWAKWQLEEFQKEKEEYDKEYRDFYLKMKDKYPLFYEQIQIHPDEVREEEEEFQELDDYLQREIDLKELSEQLIANGISPFVVPEDLRQESMVRLEGFKKGYDPEHICELSRNIENVKWRTQSGK